MIVGITEDYKNLAEDITDISSWQEPVQVVFEGRCPNKLLADLQKTPVDVLFASHHLIYYLNVPFYGTLKDLFPDIRIVIFDLFDHEKSKGNCQFPIEPKLYERTKKMLSLTAKEIYIGPHIVFVDEHDPNGFLRKLKLYYQGLYEFNDVVYISLREKYIIKLTARELAAKEIADELNISLRTVEVHKRNLMERTNSKNFIGVILYALTNRVMTLEEIYG
ncbi:MULTISPECIES: response regulator transcription factor [unclassified Myroides]|uniref:response regulator transcription factor n=1 Tax=unclassified Myroides TaxID=2642485 RepID=UPI003100AE07